MLKAMSAEENLDRLFFLTSRMIFSPEKYRGRDAAFQFDLSEDGATHRYSLEIRDGEMRDAKGAHPKPDLIVRTGVREWLGIANQTVNPVLSMLGGRMKVIGDLGLFRALARSLDVNMTRYRDEAEPWEKPGRIAWRRPEKILVCNGSPRARRGYTYYYLSRFIDGMRSTGAEVEEIHLYEKNVCFDACRGCFGCWKIGNEGNCALNDDGAPIVRKIFDSYLTVYAFPVYIDSVPARLKALMDRQFIMLKNQFMRRGDATRHPFYAEPKERYAAMFATNGFPEKVHFEPVRALFEANARGFRAPLIAQVIRPGAEALYEEPTLFPHLKLVEKSITEAGRELAEEGGVRGKTLEAVASMPRGYTKDAWYFMANRFNRLERKRPNEA
jgi:multimeric flavodoxin WrbA/putative sterol carrier protein